MIKAAASTTARKTYNLEDQDPGMQTGQPVSACQAAFLCCHGARSPAGFGLQTALVAVLVMAGEAEPTADLIMATPDLAQISKQ